MSHIMDIEMKFVVFKLTSMFNTIHRQINTGHIETVRSEGNRMTPFSASQIKKDSFCSKMKMAYDGINKFLGFNITSIFV